MAYHFTVLIEENTARRPSAHDRPEGMFEAASWQGRRLYLSLREAIRWIIDNCGDDPLRFRTITQVHTIPDLLTTGPYATELHPHGARTSIRVQQRLTLPRRRAHSRRRVGAPPWVWQQRVVCLSHAQAIDWIARNAGTTPLYEFRVVGRVLDLPDST